MEDSSEKPSESLETETLAPPQADAAARSASLGDSEALRYLIIGTLGRGGMGLVHRAYDPVLEREVALKEVRGRQLEAASAEGLMREARTMAKLSHPNVVAVYDVQQLPDVVGPSGHNVVVIVMELVDGETLSRWLSRQPRRWIEIVARFRAAGQGLAAAHEAGILHRDVKPSNIMLPAGTGVLAKITDFGIAVSGPEDSSRETKSGTPHYQPPEQLSGERATAASDQYAFCLALREALTGARVFEGPSTLEDKRRGPPAWPSGATPRRVMAAIDRGLAPDPSDRWPNMTSLLLRLSPRPWYARPAALAIVGIGSGALSLAVASQMTDEPAVANDPCGGASRLIAEVWSPARARAAGAAFRETRLQAADESWARAEEELDGYAKTWAVEHEAACRASAVFHQQSSEALDLRMACLQEARASMLAAVELFEHADPRAVLATNRVLDALPSLQPCSDVLGLREERGSAPSTLAPAALEAQRALARAQTQRIALNLEATEAELDTAQEKLGEASHPSLEIELLRQRGFLLSESGAFDEAIETRERALALAQSVRRWPDVSKEATALVRLWSANKREPAQARRYEGLALHLATTPALRVEALLALSWVRTVENDHEAALGMLEDAFATAQASQAPNFSTMLVIEQRLTQTFTLLGEFDRAEATIERALKRAIEHFGPSSQQVSHLRIGLGRAYNATGRPDLALEHSQLALAFILDTRGAVSPLHIAATEIDVATTLTDTARYSEAIDQADQALARLQPLHTQAARAAAAHATQAKAAGVFAHGSGDVLEALRLQEDALERVGELVGRDSPEYDQGRWTLGQYLLGAGDYAQAEHHLRESLTALAAKAGPDHPAVRGRQYAVTVARAMNGDADGGVAEALMAWTALGEGPRWMEARIHTAMALAVGYALASGDPGADAVQRWVDIAGELLQRSGAAHPHPVDWERVLRWRALEVPMPPTPDVLLP